MNEHTKLLIMKAGGIICSTEATGHIDKIDYLHFDAEKFAELLIKECADLCVDNVVDEICGGKNLSAKIKKHFGVNK
jgi:hypothetical protein